MKYPSLIALAILIFTFGCKENEEKAKAVIEKAEENLETLNEEVPSKLLMHDVYLNLKDSATEDDYAFAIEQLKRLDALETTLWAHAGRRAETGDSRLDKDYDLALHVVFTSEENLHEYDKDATHADVRAQLKDLLAGPPVVFDYWTEN
jgi:hypothetical protein